jgi:mannose-6-phosphate isomerase-like protein (cupin superfamily)
MPTLVSKPTRIEAPDIVIGEYIGRINSLHQQVSIALLKCPAGWTEPGQVPEFEEFTIVLKGMLRIGHQTGALDVRAGQAVVTHPGEWVQYSTPESDGGEYIAVCLPAFSLDKAHRENQS